MDEYITVLSRTNNPKHLSASNRLCATQRNSRFSAVVGPPRAYGMTWWNSSNAVSRHRPAGPSNRQRPPSRAQTARIGGWHVA